MIAETRIYIFRGRYVHDAFAVVLAKIALFSAWSSQTCVLSSDLILHLVFVFYTYTCTEHALSSWDKVLTRTSWLTFALNVDCTLSLENIVHYLERNNSVVNKWTLNFVKIYRRLFATARVINHETQTCWKSYLRLPQAQFCGCVHTFQCYVKFLGNPE